MPTAVPGNPATVELGSRVTLVKLISPTTLRPLKAKLTVNVPAEPVLVSVIAPSVNDRVKGVASAVGMMVAGATVVYGPEYGAAYPGGSVKNFVTSVVPSRIAARAGCAPVTQADPRTRAAAVQSLRRRAIRFGDARVIPLTPAAAGLPCQAARRP